MISDKFDLVALVDDNSATNFYHKVIIKNSGISAEVKDFVMAMDAIEYLKNVDEATPIPKVIFVDINMPRVSGWEFVELFGQIPMENRPTVVLMSSTVVEKDVKRAAENPLIYKILPKSLTVDGLQELYQELKVIG